jgi:hypothetical protein
MTDQLNSKNLVPFKKRRGAYSIPGMSPVDEKRPVPEVDQSLTHEEQSYIRHYLNYADMLLQNEALKSAEHLDEVSLAAGEKDMKGSKKHAA